MARVKLDEVVFQAANPLRLASGVSYAVQDRNSNPASVYSAESGGSALTSGQMVTDSRGRIDAWIEAGRYLVTFTPSDAPVFVKYLEATLGGGTYLSTPVVHSGTATPAGSLGNDGDVYFKTSGGIATHVYGPKSGGSWGSGASLTGPAGSTGPQGPQGPQGESGSPANLLLDDIPFGAQGAGDLRSGGLTAAGMRANYNPSTDRLRDTTKSGMAYTLDAGSGQVLFRKADPTTGAPTFNSFATLDSIGFALPSGTLAAGASSDTTDGVKSRILLKPVNNDDNAVTIKAPNGTWGVSQAYGKGQAFVLLKDSVSPTDYGYTGNGLEDFVVYRIDRYGAVGACANFHLATGLRAPTGYAPGYCMFINPQSPVDPPQLLLLRTAGAQTGKFILGQDTNAVTKFQINPSGNAIFGMNSSGKGLFVGDPTGDGATFGFSHSDHASGTNYAIRQDANGQTYINSASGQALLFRLGNATVFTLGTGFADFGAQFLQGTEVADPAAPGANKGRIYFRDNGGKTELVARFPTGAIQRLAIEP